MMGNGIRDDGRPVKLVVFGLSHANLGRLKDGAPIKFNGSTCGLGDDIEFLIFAGESERTMQRDFIDLIGPETKVSISPKLKD
jgi:hypothetical protein